MMAIWVETCSVYIWNRGKRSESRQEMHADAKSQTYKVQEDTAMSTQVIRLHTDDAQSQ
jgi:hypothetical protein